ncbi:YeiH family protein [Salisediminibacterium selenitireducens]|uniref:Uncharacterized protein family UPF0324 n=1 Tax=Bacillus selenitireducens (strain ATCC 700615 / DSM 15326 / MLS10) TaxID=439292 RepID=D6XZK5_BACIE|nr:putative sulfate exporter family transporter [Salisediminibacterium selenitireducens]ADH98379.1 Uncharacterized protein family UPF0324 [[Bacillus] selenitireducens MLS10]
MGRIQKMAGVIPGVFVCFVLLLASMWLAGMIGSVINQMQGLPPEAGNPVSPIFVAILLGLLIRNGFGLPEAVSAGVAFSVQVILKAGIIFLGIRLSFLDVITLGAWGIPIILICVIAGIAMTMWVTKLLKQSHRLGTLTAVGTGICGVTAIVGTAPGIKANDEEIAYAVGNITIFGIIAMFLYPYLANVLFAGDPVRAGLFLGTAIHETAQVAGASLIYDQVFTSSAVVDVATISKLTRNTMLIAVVPIMSYYYLMRQNRESGGRAEVKKWYQLIPLFVIGFLLMAGVRTVGDSGAETGLAFGVFSPSVWADVTAGLSTLGSTYLLGIAMAGVGLSTNLGVFKHHGVKPFYIGITAALTVTVVSIVMVTLLGGLISYPH